ncbi:MAG: cytochrome c [Nitrosomonas ureae]
MKKILFIVCAAAAVLGQSVAQAQDPAQIERGKNIFQQWCVSCHGVGPGHPGTQALDFRYQGAMPGALEERTNLTPDFVKVFVRNGISIMPFFRKTEISDAELADLSAYLARNAPKQNQP